MDRNTSEVAPIARLQGRRSSDRRSMPEIINPALAPAGQGAALLDISTHGCRVTGLTGTPGIGAPLLVLIGGRIRMTCWLRWASEGEAGLEFARPLADEVVDLLSEAHGVGVEFPDLAAA